MATEGRGHIYLSYRKTKAHFVNELLSCPIEYDFNAHI